MTPFPTTTGNLIHEMNMKYWKRTEEEERIEEYLQEFRLSQFLFVQIIIGTLWVQLTLSGREIIPGPTA